MGELVGAAGAWLDTFVPGTPILNYHRIAELDADPYSLAVTPERFEAHVALLAREAHPMPLLALIDALAENRVPKRAVAVTLDDGYADLLHSALPVLEKHGVPATVFVAAGHLGAAKEFWWDALEQAVLHPERLPDELMLEIDGQTRHWRLGAAVDLPRQERERLKGFSLDRPEDPTPRHRFFRTLWRLLRERSAEVQDGLLSQLRAWAGVQPKVRRTHAPLTAEELLALSRSKLVEIGAHTVTHPILSRLPPAVQRTEIAESKRQLEAVLDRPVRTFAYPYGRAVDFTRTTMRLVKESGFACACSTIARMTRPGVDPLQLPRLSPEGLSPAGFDQWLARALA